MDPSLSLDQFDISSEQFELLDDIDDVLNSLEFSVPDFLEPPPAEVLAQPPLLPPPPPSQNNEFSGLLARIEEASFRDLGEDEVLEMEGYMPAAADAGGCDRGPKPMNEIMVAPPAWTPAELLDCSCCYVLREVVHTNGIENIKLSLHGGPGFFYHATLDVYIHEEGFPSVIEQSYIDLSTQSFAWVKQFLLNYGLLRMHDKYAIMQDSLCAFYDALCVPMTCEQAQTGSPIDPSLSTSGLCEARLTEFDGSNASTSKTRIATQRERTKSLKLRELANYFHLPIADAAKELEFCPTALKKVCRKHGVPRWPHRKFSHLREFIEQIKSIDNMISKLERELQQAGTAEGAMRAGKEIERLNDQRARICAGFPP